MQNYRRFAAVFDIHRGYEIVGGHKKPLHDPRAWETTLKFLSDFKPQDFIFGGDILDCGAISHHSKGKIRQTEGMRIIKDAEDCQREVIAPIERLLPKDAKRVYLTGNHELWLEDLMDEHPQLEGMFDIKQLLKLDKWKVIENGRGFDLGRLHFLHGDTVGGGDSCAKAGVINYGRNVRFGHHHTYQTYTKTSPVDRELPHTGIAVPCLCSKDVGYMRRKPNRWVQGFEYGEMSATGPFADTIAIIINGGLVINGKKYQS